MEVGVSSLDKKYHENINRDPIPFHLLSISINDIYSLFLKLFSNYKLPNIFCILLHSFCKIFINLGKPNLNYCYKFLIYFQF